LRAMEPVTLSTPPGSGGNPGDTTTILTSLRLLAI
jgi:hypothetical protein